MSTQTARMWEDREKRVVHTRLKDAVVAAAMHRHAHAGAVPDALDHQLDFACEALNRFEKGSE